MSQDSTKYQAEEPRSADQIEAGVIVSPDTRRAQRLPPGQTRTRKWPILDAFGPPEIDLQTWRLRVFGRVERPYELSLEAFRQLPRVKVYADFHCVTRWSRLDNLWEGVSTRALVERAGVQPDARFVVCHAYDNNWTTNLPLAEFLGDDCLLTDTHDGAPISRDHGGPVRGVIPRLYAWKSAKWIRGIELVAEDRPGYWERGGYHHHGDPWREERYGW